MNEYTENISPDAMHENALHSGETTFVVLSGDSVIVTASSAEEAERKYVAQLFGNPCPCDQEDCECVVDGETLTLSWPEVELENLNDN